MQARNILAFTETDTSEYDIYIYVHTRIHVHVHVPVHVHYFIHADLTHTVMFKNMFCYQFMFLPKNNEIPVHWKKLESPV